MNISFASFNEGVKRRLKIRKGILMLATTKNGIPSSTSYRANLESAKKAYPKSHIPKWAYLYMIA